MRQAISGGPSTGARRLKRRAAAIRSVRGRSVEHGFVMLSTQARLLILLAPAGQEQALQALSTPVESPAFIRPTHPPSPEPINEITAQHSAYGVRFTRPPPPSPERR